MMLDLRCTLVALVFYTCNVEVFCQSNDKFIKAANCFSLNLLAKIKTEDGNEIASAFSVDAVLSMLLAGAKGNTAEQLNKVLQYKTNGLTDEEVQKQFKSTLQRLNDSKNVTMNIANSIWMDKKYPIKDDYKKTVEADFLAETRNVNFAGDAHQATEDINQWTDQKTNGLIQKAFDEDLGASTILVLLNAIYFKGQWLHKFDKSRTKPQTFYNKGDKNAPKMVQMMNQENKFMYKNDPNIKAEVVRMNYVGQEFSFILYLPDEKVGLDRFESGLSCENLEDFLQVEEEAEVNLTMPTIDMSTDLNLVQPLKDLGVTDMFDNADLSGIAEGGSQVSDVFQKAKIIVNEEGSEAAAVTGGVVTTSVVIPTKRVSLLVDRPFCYFIIDKSGLILFAGRVNQL